MKNSSALFLFVIITLMACNDTDKEIRSRIDLQGEWQFQLDKDNKGIEENYPAKQFREVVSLPGTTDTNRKGEHNTKKDETSHLSRIYKYVGKAWYKKEVDIPVGWNGKDITMILERTKPTHVWIDGKEAGSNDDISTPQIYNLTNLLTPGKHEITIMVDNGQSVPRQLLSNSHAYTESTQTNWNGIIGEIFLEAKDQLHIKSVQVYSDATKRTISVKVAVGNADRIVEGTQMKLSAQSWNSNKKHSPKPLSIILESGKNQYEIIYLLGEDALLWSEFSPALYKLNVSIKGHDIQSVDFGLRNFAAQGTQFAINGHTTFLRGKHDACVFPLTAHTPMDVESWRRYFQVCKEYGINHCRFHSWCPPRACFEAADIEGIYLQPELPFWGGLRRKEEYLTRFLLKEGIHIQNEYGNHASFVMFALGNELSGELDLMEEFTDKFREVDNRHIYAYGSNNFLGFKGYIEGEDFLVTCRIGGADDYSTHTRGSFSFADAPEGGYINNTYPNSIMNFDGAIANCPVPVISHETGQFQVYPNYHEMEKYTGVLSPVNFGIFKERLEKTGMLEQADDFFRASGRWSALLYKADIEMDLRTKGFGGFQLLDLQDYPGQGSAYVGILDAFMDNKGHISPEEWREFCNDVVPLFEIEKFCWTDKEVLTGKIKIANYSSSSLKGQLLKWAVKDQEGHILDNGELTINAPGNGLLEIGNITPSLSSVGKPTQVLLEIGLQGTPYRNRYPLWIYPDNPIATPAEGIVISRKLDNKLLSSLESGKKVLFMPDCETYDSQTVGGLFQTDYWNYRMFKGICDRAGKPASPGTLGILTNPEHPVFNDFPTDYHTNWQWYTIIKESYPLIMDRMPAGYKPIVQVIDNVERNHRLGLIFEFTVGQGKLLVCMSDLEAVSDKPETRQLYSSMLAYMDSDKFNPEHKLSFESLKALFTTANESDELKELINISYVD